MKERIQKILGNVGVASRRQIEEMIQQGRVTVNGKVMTQPPILIDPERDKVKVDDELIKLSAPQRAGRVYFLLNKPRGVYSTNVAQGEQKRAIDLLPPGIPRVYPVGRLDADSRGLLLLTNDGELTNQLTHPSYGVAKTYRATVDGYVAPEEIEQLQKGIWLADPKKGTGFKTGRTRIKIVKRGRQMSILEITIREGRNRQVRRMLARVGHKVRELTRIKMGPLTIEGLASGKYRQLTPRELQALKRLAKPKPDGDSKPIQRRNS